MESIWSWTLHSYIKVDLLKETKTKVVGLLVDFKEKGMEDVQDIRILDRRKRDFYVVLLNLLLKNIYQSSV